MRFARRRREATPDPVADVRRFAREALGEHSMVKAEPRDGVGAVIIRAGEDRALVWVRPADPEQPALFQSSVWMSDLDDPASSPVFDPPVSADQLDAALRFLAGERRWTPVDVEDDSP